MSWSIRTTKKDGKQYPICVLDCPRCRTTTTVVSGVNGFGGRVPVVRCCIHAEDFPSTDEFQEHLQLKPLFEGALDKRWKASPVRDAWASDDDYVSYVAGDYQGV